MWITARVVYNHFDKYAEMINQQARDLVAKTADEIAADIRASAPGNRIGKSVIIRDQAGGLRKVITVGDLRKKSMHAAFVEYGTVHRAATPFATPAAETARPRFVSGMKSLIRRGL